MAMPQTPKRKDRKIWILTLLLSLLLLIGGACWYIFTHPWWNRDPDTQGYHDLPTSELSSGEALASGSSVPSEAPGGAADSSTPGTEPDLPDNPIRFEELWDVNSSVYAWIYVPMGGTGKDIDYPVLQSEWEEDDNFYLHHNLNKQYQFSGCVYTQKQNKKDFSDRVTVVYGHNMLDGTMFSNLVWFQDAHFFEEHDTFYIYTPGHILTYRIAAAIQFDDRHILNSFDFSDDDVYENWIRNYVLEPKTMLRSVREDLDITLDDRLVILSTCLEHGAYRYLIQGVLISDEPTK